MIERLKPWSRGLIAMAFIKELGLVLFGSVIFMVEVLFKDQTTLFTKNQAAFYLNDFFIFRHTFKRSWQLFDFAKHFFKISRSTFKNKKQKTTLTIPTHTYKYQYQTSLFRSRSYSLSRAQEKRSSSYLYRKPQSRKTSKSR